MVLSVTCFRASSRRGCDEGVRTDEGEAVATGRKRRKKREREREVFSAWRDPRGFAGGASPTWLLAGRASISVHQP